MSLTSNKFVRICFCWVLLVVACISMMFISKGDKAPSVDEVDQVCVQGALTESWMYVITDKAFLEETLAMFDSLEYEESDDAVNMMDPKKSYSLTYSNGNEQVKKYIVDDNGMICFEAGTQSYKITSEFDFSKLSTLVQKQIDKFNAELNATS